MVESVKTGDRGLQRARYLYENRPARVKELRAAGQPVLGYFCLYPVLEIMTALDITPYRIFGSMNEPITRADAALPTVVCPFVRSALDLGLKGKYDFLNGVVMCHSCEVGEKFAHIWKTYLTPKYFHFIDVPHTTHLPAREQFKNQLIEFTRSLEKFAGKKLEISRLKEAIDLHNHQRQLVRQLYDLRKLDPPLISGTETLRVMVALMSMPVAEGIELLDQVLEEIQNRKDLLPRKGARLLIWGSILDDISLVQMIEDLDAQVVMDDTCVGSRAFFADVRQSDDPMTDLAYRYLVELKCPRTFRESAYGETKKDYLTDLESRFGYVRDFARDWNANGVVLQSVKYCDIHGYEVPLIRDYLEHEGLPSIYIEHDYNRAAMAPLKTRIQAFIEVIG